MPTYRELASSDRGLLEDFLVPRLESSMILLSNSRSAGLLDHGERHQGSYAGAFDHGVLVGVVAHYWNCNCIIQAPSAYVAKLCSLAMRASGRPLSGMLGPAEQVRAGLSGLGLGSAGLRLDSVEGLFQLPLAALVVPAALTERRVLARVARPDELPLLTRWRVEYCVESLNAADTPELHEASREAELRRIVDGMVWVVEEHGRAVATSGFNAATREAVQIGGVYTPPELRGRGYARAVVAQSLLDARARGIARSILFTGDDNLPAQAAYRSLGYERIGDYRIVTLEQPVFR